MPVVSVSKTISRAGVRVASINMSDVHFPPDPALESGTPIIGLESRVFLAGKRPHKRLYFSKGARLAAACRDDHVGASPLRSEEHTSELQSLMRISYAVFCLKKKKTN